jgi:hypothetical protein
MDLGKREFQQLTGCWVDICWQGPFHECRLQSAEILSVNESVVRDRRAFVIWTVMASTGSKANDSPRPAWAKAIRDLRQRLKLSRLLAAESASRR